MEKATLSLVEYLKKGDSESKKGTPRVEQMVNKVHFLKKATPSWQHRVNKVAFWMEKATLSLVEYLKKGDSESKKATPRVEQMVNKVHFLKKATPSWQHRVNKVAFWMEKATLSLVEYLKKGDSESKKATYL